MKAKAKKTEITSALDKRINFMLLVEINNSLLNGDPDNNGEQRLDSNGRAVTSDVCLKRIVREYVTKYYSHIPGFDVFFRSGREESISELAHNNPCELLFGKTFEQCTKEATLKGKKPEQNAPVKVVVNGEETEISYREILNSLQRDIISRYWDQRVFGTAPTLEFNPFQGCVCFVESRSVAPVFHKTMSITTCMAYKAEQGKDNKTFGSRSVVEHALVKISGTIDVSLAEKSGMTFLDYEVLRDALINGFEGLSSTRGGNRTVFYADIIHKTKRGAGNVRDIFQSGINVSLNSELDFSNDLGDYSVEIGELPNNLVLNVHHKSPDLVLNVLDQNSLNPESKIGVFTPLEEEYVAGKAETGN